MLDAISKARADSEDLQAMRQQGHGKPWVRLSKRERALVMAGLAREYPPLKDCPTCWERSQAYARNLLAAMIFRKAVEGRIWL
jgi:hypothetical protein